MIALYIILSVILLIFILLHFSVVLSVDYSDNKFTAKAKYLFFTIYPFKEKKKNKKRQIRKNKRKKKKLQKKLAKEKAKYEKLKKKKQQQSKSVTDSINQPIHETKEKIDSEDNVPDNEPKDKSDDKHQHKAENFPFNDGNEEESEKNKLFEKLDDLKDKWEDIKPYIPLGKKAVKKLIKAIRVTDLKIDIAVADEDAYECAMSYGKMNGAIYGALGVITSFLTVSIKKVNISAKYNSPDSEYAFSGKIKTRPSTIIALAVFILFKYIYTKFKLEKRENETEM